ncbi:Sodium/hydrogen exchanger family [Weissella viridescens]|uniref:Sodium/hydrogen exchanger family n=1 Tax=Weissella viridescens TaxID=1629 RepID=A0A380P261_WEIVI|nr:Sodium/hydrogen exchanger family [Weissella viridescens]
MVSFDNFWNEAVLLVILTIVAVATKYYGAGWGAQLAGIGKTDSRAIGAGMISRGEMALVIAQIGLSTKLLITWSFRALLSSLFYQQSLHQSYFVHYWSR